MIKVKKYPIIILPHKDFIHAFVKFLKKEGAFGEFISEKWVSILRGNEPFWVSNPMLSSFNAAKQMSAIGSPFIWAATKDGAKKWEELSTKWATYFREEFEKYKGLTSV